MVNYQEEVKKLDAFKPKDNLDYWDPAQGQYKVKGLTELEEAEPYEEEGKDPKPRVKIDLMIDGKKQTWTLGVGKSPASSYGQLCKLAAANNNTLKNVEFIIVVTNDGKKNTYTIVR